MNQKKWFFIVLLLPVMFWTGAAKAQACPQCATFVQQLIDNVTFVSQLEQQMQMVQQQMTTVSQGAQNLTALPQQMWTSFTGPMNQMMNIVGKSEGLAYNTINSAGQIKQLYGDPNGIISNYQQKLQSWISNNQSQIASVLQANKINATASMSNAQQIQAIASASQSAVGQLQVMQAANQIAALQANQLQGLQADIQAGNQYMMNYTAAQDAQKAQDTNMRSKFYEAPVKRKWGY